MKKATLIIIAIIGISSFFNGTCKKKPSDSQVMNIDPLKNGYVPDEATAIKVAEAIWLPIYGNDIYDKQPFQAKLSNDSIWIVEGSLRPDELGGVPYAEIQKSDCKIIKVIHTK